MFVQGDVADTVLVKKILADHSVDSVIHFAGSIVVPDSVADPLGYYENNVVKSRALIEACVAGGVKHFIFSSTAAVYDADAKQPLAEAERKGPISPYARSKLMTEWMLEDVSRAHPIRHTVLRYFNVAGADPLGRTGQSTPKATHLIKRAAQVVLGRASHLDMFGTDYPTPDGTGVRDYIHVSDLAAAHLLALDSLQAGAPSTVYNCGYGRGFSVREVIQGVERVTGRPLPVKESPAGRETRPCWCPIPAVSRRNWAGRPDMTIWTASLPRPSHGNAGSTPERLVLAGSALLFAGLEPH